MSWKGMVSGRGSQGLEFQAGNLDLERLEAHVLRTLPERFSGLSKYAKTFQAKGTRHQKLQPRLRPAGSFGPCIMVLGRSQSLAWD